MKKPCLLAILCLVATTAVTSAVDIEETVWGFDGRVVPYQFNPVSLLVSNTTEESVEILLELKRSYNSGGPRIGARNVEAVFLAPFSSRWVQFYPYISNDHDEWSASWGLLPHEEKDLKKPRIGGPARVALVASNQLTRGTSEVKTFAEELFPPFVSAASTLEVLYLDHVPRWQDQRRQALLDWVQAGGTLFVTPGSSGEYPAFTGQLAIFNSPLPELMVGQGKVIRAESRNNAVAMAEQRLGKSRTPQLSANDWNLSSGYFQRLKDMTSPKHNWPVIHILSLMYIALVFPGWYLLSKRPTSHRTTIVAFLGIAVLFTIIFNVVGRRGYDESTTVSTLAVARRISGVSYDVQSWTNVFVTGGDQYELTYEGEGDLFGTGSAGTTLERVGGIIDNGLDGRFVVDIPLFSSRAFIHQGKAVGPNWDVVVKEFSADRNGLIELKLDISPEPPKGSQCFVVFGDNLFSLYERDGYFYTEKRPAKRIDASLVEDDFANPYSYYNYTRGNRTSNLFGELTYPAIARDLKIPLQRVSETQFQLPQDRIRVLLYTELPASFSVKHPELQASQGKVLYSMDVWLPDAAVVDDKDELENEDQAGEAKDAPAADSEEEQPLDEIETESTVEALPSGDD